MLGFPRDAPCPSWLIGALTLQSPRLKLLGHARIKVALDFSLHVSFLASQCQSLFTASGNGTYAAGLALVLMDFWSTSYPQPQLREQMFCENRWHGRDKKLPQSKHNP